MYLTKKKIVMFVKLLLIVIAILAIAFLIMGFNIFFRKNKKFPKSSVGGNKDMRNLGLKCARHEEIKCRKDIDKKKESEGGCAGCV